MSLSAIGLALLISGFAMFEDFWKNREREQASDCVLPVLFILGGFGSIVYEVTYFLGRLS